MNPDTKKVANAATYSFTSASLALSTVTLLVGDKLSTTQSLAAVSLLTFVYNVLLAVLKTKVNPTVFNEITDNQGAKPTESHL